MATASTSKLPPIKAEDTDDKDLFDEGELERILSSEASLVTREQEVRPSLWFPSLGADAG